MNLKIANRLLALRREHGYSQEELAYKLGVSRQAVSKWERAESSPDTDNLLALARLYGVSLDALLLHTPAGEAAQAAPEPEEAPADEDAEIFAAARAWDAAEEAEQKARKRARAKWSVWARSPRSRVKPDGRNRPSASRSARSNVNLTQNSCSARRMAWN